MLNTYELNLDGLVGPTHHYAGLAFGNLASSQNAYRKSNPKAAALQGLHKMRLLHQLGIKQAFLPPQERPNLSLLSQLGFADSLKGQLQTVFREAPDLLSASFSASYMWAANAATVSASHDTADKRLHFTSANLVSNLHRHQEAKASKKLLEIFFNNEDYFKHHPVLPATLVTSDEGAANHCRMCEHHGSAALNFFVYGRSKGSQQHPTHFPARQSLDASQAIVRSHLLDHNRVVFAQQNPLAIDAGVFHNDVIAMSNENLLLIHEDALVNQASVLDQLKQKANFSLQIIEIKRSRLSLTDAVQSYFFNSQLLTLPVQTDSDPKTMVIVAPIECQENAATQDLLNELIADKTNPIIAVHYLDLRQSMRNGGGPACLRLRIPIHDNALKAMHQGILITEERLVQLQAWVEKHYRDELCLSDLCDPDLVKESHRALDDLSSFLSLGRIYTFQH